MVKKHETWSNVTSSNPTCPPPRLFHHHRFKDGISIVSPIVHPPIIESPKKKRKKKNSATMCLHSGKDNGIKTRTQGTRRNSLKKSIVRVRGSAAKMAAPHQAIPRRGWWHTHRWPRFCRFSVPFFFSSLELPLSPSRPCNTLWPTLSRTARGPSILS